MFYILIETDELDDAEDNPWMDRTAAETLEEIFVFIFGLTFLYAVILSHEMGNLDLFVMLLLLVKTLCVISLSVKKAKAIPWNLKEHLYLKK